MVSFEFRVSGFEWGCSWKTARRMRVTAMGREAR
jgi:hypothetical protein